MEKKKIQDQEQKYHKERLDADNLLGTGKPLDKMTINELKTLLKPLKMKDDGQMPSKKKDLLACYEKWKNRTPPSFEYIDDANIETVAVETVCNDEEESLVDNNVITSV